MGIGCGGVEGRRRAGVQVGVCRLAAFGEYFASDRITLFGVGRVTEKKLYPTESLAEIALRKETACQREKKFNGVCILVREKSG